MTTKKIYPGNAARLEFIVEDSDGLPVPSLDHTDVSSSAYRNITNGVRSSPTTATVTSSVASTASVSAGQFVTIDSARGHYAIDVASGAAGSTLDVAEAVVVFTAGHTVTPIQHEIDETLFQVVQAIGTIDGVDGKVDTVQTTLNTIGTNVDTINLNTENIPSTLSDLAVAVDNVYQIVLSNLDVAVSVIQSQITALNNLSAKANWFGHALLEIPDSGTRPYVFELVTRDDEDKLVNLDSSPTIALVNSAGTDRSALITTGIANPATGRYTITITVGTSTTNESLKLTASGTISGEARYASYGTQVVDYDTATLVNQILTTLGVNGAGLSAIPWNAAWDTEVQSECTDALNAYDPPTRAELTTDTNSVLTAVGDVPTNAELTTALGNGSWATALGDTRLANLDATMSSRSSQTSVNTIGTNVDTLISRVTATVATMWGALVEMISGTTPNRQFTVKALELAPSGGGGGGGDCDLEEIKGDGWDASTDTLEKIRDAISLVSSISVVIPSPVEEIIGMPETLEIGDSYDGDTPIKLYVRDENDDPVTSFAGHDFTDVDFAPTFTIAPTPGSVRGRVVGDVTWVPASGPDEGYLKVEISSLQSRRAVEGESSVQCVAKWDGYEKSILTTTVRWLPRI